MRACKCKWPQILSKQLQQAQQDKGAAVVMDPANGDLLAAVSFPLPPIWPDDRCRNSPTDRCPTPTWTARATASIRPAPLSKWSPPWRRLRKDQQLTHKTYECIRLPDGRVGNYIKGSTRPIRDDVEDKSPHGTVDMERGIIVSCNAYFAQLGTYDVGAQPLLDTANLLGIAAASPNTAAQLKKSLPQSSYGQGQVVASPFQMARVAATVANGGQMPEGRWITDETNTRTATARSCVAAPIRRNARQIHARSGDPAPAAAPPDHRADGRQDRHRRLAERAFARLVHRLCAVRHGRAPHRPVSVLVENGVYGGTAAAPAAAEIVNAAVKLGITWSTMSLFSGIEKTIERGFRAGPNASSAPPTPTS